MKQPETGTQGGHLAPMPAAGPRPPVHAGTAVRGWTHPPLRLDLRCSCTKGLYVGSVIKKRRKRMAKKKHRKLLKKTRVQRRRLGK